MITLGWMSRSTRSVAQERWASWMVIFRTSERAERLSQER
jgi:hypothetical protein